MTREIARKYFGLRPLFNNTMLKQEEDLSNRINKGSTLKTNKTEQSNDNIQTDYKAITADKRQITRTQPSWHREAGPEKREVSSTSLPQRPQGPFPV